MGEKECDLDYFNLVRARYNENRDPVDGNGERRDGSEQWYSAAATTNGAARP